MKASLEQAFRDDLVPSQRLGMPVVGAAASRLAAAAQLICISSLLLERRFENGFGLI
ncbi:MAG: hypothetical protein V7K86_04970 [Nostoc sp.]|uniref:hypothetical protein n=1 Tax=Nostoc sp. TaxID=1180 RepID=UPI002FF77A2A